MAKTLFERDGKHHLVVRENDGRVRFYDYSNEGCTLDFSRNIVVEDGSVGENTYAFIPVVEDGSHTLTSVSRGIEIAKNLGLIVEFRDDEGKTVTSVDFITV